MLYSIILPVIIFGYAAFKYSDNYYQAIAQLFFIISIGVVLLGELGRGFLSNPGPRNKIPYISAVVFGAVAVGLRQYS